MPLKTKVKVGNITNLSDARYCAGMGVDLLGFPCGDFQNFKGITSWVSGPSLVVEWTDQDIPPDFADRVQPYNANYLQVRAQHLDIIPPLAIPLIAVLPLKEWSTRMNSLLRNKTRVAFLLLTDRYDAGHEEIRTIMTHFPTLAQVGADDDIGALLRLPITGLALEGTAEDSPGLKDYAPLSEILDQLEASDENAG